MSDPIPVPDPDQDRRRFADRLEAGGVSSRRFIDVRDGEKGTRTTGHQEAINWMDADDDGLSGNYGIHPGFGHIVFDEDDYKDEHDTEAVDSLPATFSVVSPHTQPEKPGHDHFIVENVEEAKEVLKDIAGTLNPDMSWGEIKFKGKYVVGPGSQLDGCGKEWCDECAKPDGGYYRIAEDRPIATITTDQLAEVLHAEFSDEGDEQKPASEVFDLPPEEEEEGGEDREEWLTEADIREALTHIDPDMKREKWVRVGYALGGFFDDSTALALYEEWSRGGSKWDDDAERSAPDIIDRADPGDGGKDATIGTVVELAKRGGWDLSTCPSAQAKRAQRLEGATDGGTVASTPTEPTATDGRGGSETTIDLDPDGVIAIAGLGEGDSVADLNDRKKAACVWELIKRTDEWHLRVRRDNGSLWVYDDDRGVWTDEGERALRHAARQALDPMNYGSNVLAELKAQARSDPEGEEEGDDFGLEPGLLAAENGLIDLDTAGDDDEEKDARRDLRPDDLALNRVPTRYDPTAEYDEWAAYVEEWAEDGMADALQEYVGYCLEVGSMPIHRALLLVGSGANGKGTFLSVVRSLLGEENYEAIDLQTLANEKDARADFYGMIANIDDDLSSRSLGKGLGMFKKLVAGEPVRARRLYQDGFKFKATGKHLYAANEVPDVDVPDDDEAFWRRWLLIEFPNHYPIDQQDPDLGGRLTEPEALSGVLNWAIEGRKRLLEQGHFTNEDIHASQKRERWQAWGDSVGKFINECTERDEDAVNITTTDAHRRYAAWCRENGEKPVGQQQLTNKLKNEDVGYGQSVRVGESVQRGYKALGFTDAVPAIADTPAREEPARVNLTNYDEAGDSDEDDEIKPKSTDIAANSAQKPISKAIEESDDGAPIGDVLDAVPHTPEKAREHIEAMIDAGTITRGDDGRLRTE